MQGGFAGTFGEGSPQRLAVDADQFAAAGLVQRLRPLEKAGRKLPAVQQPEHAPEGIVRGIAAGQREKRFQPIVPQTPKGLQIRPIIRPAEHRQDRDRHNVQQQMMAGCGDPWFLQLRKMAFQSLDKLLCCTIHGRAPPTRSRGPAASVAAGFRLTSDVRYHISGTYVNKSMRRPCEYTGGDSGDFSARNNPKSDSLSSSPMPHRVF